MKRESFQQGPFSQMDQIQATEKPMGPSPLKNQRGQMAIFIALFFQVLFVFFAMAINVGLVVHDKINLQNAVDLAAYYGAAKQAEVLNQIAHINYQMRQNYKLFVWRYRILGTIGLNGHPLNPETPVTGLLDETLSSVVPSVCVVDKNWQESEDRDSEASFCSYADVTIPNIRPASGGGGFVPGYDNLVAFTEMANRALIDQCLQAGIFNWIHASRILIHFRVDGLLRKRMIQTLAQNLHDGKDIKGESIENGVRNTMEKNLTNSQQIQNFQYFNSMNGAGCEDPSKWLSDIKIQPVILFTDFDGNPERCDSSSVANRETDVARPQVEGSSTFPIGFFKNSELYNLYNYPELKDHWRGEPNDDLHSSVGFEKNPWCLVYTGVSATSSVRKPFAPGGAVTLSARGYAKPFGGRIGPWYGKTWVKGSPNSDAFQRVDPLLPSRNVPGTAVPSDPQLDIANHSRFPGDPLGMTSQRAITSMADRFRTEFDATPNASFAWGAYSGFGDVDILKSNGDSLARESISPINGITTPPLVRRYELAAIMPDAFDALYYSIEPNYHSLYFGPNTTSGTEVFQDEDKIYDFGSSKEPIADAPTNFSIINMIENTKDLYHPSIDYIVRDWRHLLTSWHQNKAVEYSMDDSRFGVCRVPISKPEFPTTGNCVEGGRTGYSVKSVSRDYLLSDDLELGGEGGTTGSIINTPPF